MIILLVNNPVIYIFFSGTPSYGLKGDSKAKKKLEAPDISLTLDCTGSSALTAELEESTEMDLEDIDTPSDNSNEFDWEGRSLGSWRCQRLLFTSFVSHLKL